MQKIVYIAHPISGNIEENLKDIIRILRIINTNSHPKLKKELNGFIPTAKRLKMTSVNFSDIIPLAPYYADILALDDNNPVERARGIQNDVALIKSGLFKELWLTGERISFGMEQEIKLFTELELPTINYIGKI